MKRITILVILCCVLLGTLYKGANYVTYQQELDKMSQPRFVEHIERNGNSVRKVYVDRYSGNKFDENMNSVK